MTKLQGFVRSPRVSRRGFILQSPYKKEKEVEKYSGDKVDALLLDGITTALNQAHKISVAGDVSYHIRSSAENHQSSAILK